MSLITVIGGGPAGLATCYYAKKQEIEFVLFEADSEVGGNCKTRSFGSFKYDTGAHRFHDRSPEVTDEVRKLLDNDLLEVVSASHVYIQGQYFVFPPAISNLFLNLKFSILARVLFENIKNRLQPAKKLQNFKEYACQRYGKSLATLFLLNYSSKLWGLDCSLLSTSIAGSRLKGLKFSDFIFRSKVSLEGMRFYYPRHGYGQICDALADKSGRECVKLGSKITKILHEKSRITAIEVNHKEVVPVEYLVSSIPLHHLIHLLQPALPSDVLNIANSIKFRDLILVVLQINRPKVTCSATVYFPDKEFPFTRVFEPKNRSAMMAPSDQTSLVIEVPIDSGQTLDAGELEQVKNEVIEKLLTLDWFARSELMDSRIDLVKFAYPIFDLELEGKNQAIVKELSSFGNLHICGRNANLQYSWMHDMFHYGKKAVECYVSKTN